LGTAAVDLRIGTSPGATARALLWKKPAELIRAAINIIGHDVEMASFEFAAIDQHLPHASGAHLGEG